jgi:cytochrome c-type biogenesis protein CcmH/NrfG
MRTPEPSLALFQHQTHPRRAGRWVLAAVAVVAGVFGGAWFLARRPAPPAAAEPVATAPAASETVPASTATPAQPEPAPAPAASEASPAVPQLAGSPKQDAPDAEEPGEADYRAAVQAAREANAASNWDVEAEQYRRALAVHPASLEAKEGLGSAIVKSAGRAGSYLEAERLLAEVVRTDAARSRAWLVLGMARQLGARPVPAVEAYRRYLDLEPQGPMASDVRDVVRALDRRDVAQRRPGR